MKTQRLFKEDVYMKEAEAVITSLAEANGRRTAVTLDKTIFFPTGGGQSCDKGTIAGFQVVDVYEDEKADDIVHVLDCSPEDIEGLAAYKEQNGVQLILDWEHRFDNMQRHCGEHILSGMFFREYGGVNRGFHMGDQYMTIDISLEAMPEFTAITWEMAKHVEECANEAIWQNQPVITRHFDTKKEAENLPLRKALALEKDITIVCVGSVENPADCVACCGTHPATAGQVGLIKIFKVESNKGMFRIYFEAGKRAFLKYQNELDTLTTLANSLSAGTDDVLSKYHAQVEKNKESRNQLHFLKKEVIARETADIAAALERGENVRRYHILSLDDLTVLAREVSPHANKIAFLVHEPSYTVFLVSDGSVDCGKLVKDNAQIYGGKGGGNKTTARAIFTKDEYVDTFIDLIEKHLR
ncbi:MAG: alanyl-tRNA editing protein [Firmicutes bacterium]|nr:alanyl-tRNA editing protein [Bacillota bacterium]